MQITVGKISALLIALGYVIGIIIHEHGFTWSVLVVGVVLLLPLKLIWFPEWSGSWTNFSGLGASMGQETHPFLVSTAGWLFLVILPMLAYFLSPSF